MTNTRTTTTKKFHVVGCNDEQTECDACGKVELRKTVILADQEGECGRYGTTCASRMLGWTVTIDDARRAEAVRRQGVAYELRLALAAESDGDLAAARWRVKQARRLTLVRPDEFRIATRIEATA